MFKRTMFSNVLTATAISRALLSSYVTRYIKNINSFATTPLQFRNGMTYNFVTELSHLLCDRGLCVFANYIFWHKQYELSLIIDIGLLHIYLSVGPITAKIT